MARQRFIWPELWKDKRFGELKHDEQVLFIALFSLADDEGRLSADPMLLRSEVFAYKDYTAKRVRTIRDHVAEKMPNVWLYEADGLEYIQLRKWSDYQRPKYPKPSKIPPPLEEDSPNDSPDLPPRVGLGREGLDREGAEPPNPTSARPVETVDNLPANRFVPPGSDSAQTLTTEFVDACRDADIEAPRRVIGQMAQATRRLLDEGIGGEAIRNGYRRMVQRGMIQPAMLPNFVAEASIPSGLRAVNGRGLTPSEILARTQEAQ